jgi:hypothetical protein
MTGSIVIDVAIGLILVYLTFSLFCSAINEWIARFLALRSAGLRKGINDLFDDVDESQFAKLFHEHPLIDALKPSKAPVLRRFLPSAERVTYPSYISARTFALTVLDISADITSSGTPGVTGRAVLKPAANMAAPLPASIQALMLGVEGDAAAMQLRLEQWFNDAMDRVSGWYKRRTHVILFFIGLITAAMLNIDSFAVVRQLIKEPSVREALVKQADDIVARQQGQPVDSIRDQAISQQLMSLQQGGLTIGWNTACSPTVRWLGATSPLVSVGCSSGWETLIGILITSIALSFGAPFWFDALNRLTNLRQAGTPPEGSKK